MADNSSKPGIIIPLLLVTFALVAIVGSLVYWPPQAGVNGIPPSLVHSMVVASISFLVFSWLTIYFGTRSPVWFVLIGLVIWYSLVVFLGRVGFFGSNTFFLPNIVYGFIVLYYFGKYLLSRPKFQQLAAAIPPHYIMNVQVFRVMGVGFINLYLMGILPGVFALPTGIGDVLIGLTGPIVGYLYLKDKNRWKNLAIHWHRAGIADLVLALTLAIITYSRPIRILPTQIPSDPIALYPLAIIPLFAVPLSIMLHLFGLKVLKSK